MNTYLKEIFTRKVDRKVYLSSIDNRRHINTAYGYRLTLGFRDNPDGITRDLRYYIEDLPADQIYELSSDSFNLLLLWSMGNDPTITGDHVAQWLANACEIWGSVRH